MAAYDFRADFSGIAPGTRYGIPQMKIAWNNNPNITSYRNTDTGTLPIYTIVDDPVMGRCLQQFYPQGVLGESYHGNPFPTESSYGSPPEEIFTLATDVINAALDVMFPTDFDLVGSQGKVYRICNGGTGVGVALRVMWNYTTGNSGPCHFRLFAGTALVELPNTVSPWDIVPNTVYRLHFQMNPDPNTGWQKIWIKRPTDPSEVLLYNNGPVPTNTAQSPANTCELDHSSFFGGGGAAQAAKIDSRMLTGNFHIWTGIGAETGTSTDTTAPTVPLGLAANPAGPTAINLSWNASTDNVGVAGYHLRRGGTIIATQAGLTFSDTGLSPSTTYSYTVDAFDAAGNVSAQSSPPVSARTPGVVWLASAALVGGSSVFVFTTSTFHPVAGTIYHKTYAVDGGAYGSPSGSDYTIVLQNIQTQILTDQAKVGDGNLRAAIVFNKGSTYQYTDNGWTQGIQYYDVIATGSGARPVLQCTLNSPSTYSNGPLAVGWPGEMKNDTQVKSNSCLIQSVAAGASAITLITPSQATRLVAGRWHAIMGSSIQIGGEPPNVMFIDYVMVLAVNAVTGAVTLDRPLKYKYSSTWYEDPNDSISIGQARIVLWDTGGSAGPIPSDPRLSLRGRWTGVEFRANPVTGDNITYADGHIQLDFDNCLLSNPQVSMLKHVGFYNCTTAAGGEPDKMSETIIFDNCTTGILGGATGYLYWFSRNTTHGCLQIAARQFRAQNCIFDPNGDTNLQLPLTFAFNGPLWDYDIENCTFKPNTSNLTLTWTYSGQPGSSTNFPVVIGTDATWNGNQLRIPRTFANFEGWLIAAYEGLILTTDGNAPAGVNWGYVNNVTSPGDGTALWLDVTWVNGVKPLSGHLYPIGRTRHLNFVGNTFVSPMSWADPQFISEQASPNANWDFPIGYPPIQNSAFGAPSYAPSWTTPNPMAGMIVAFSNSSQVVCAGSGALACNAAALSPHVQSGSAILAGHGAIPADGRPTAWWLGSVGGATVNLSLTTQFNVLPGESILVLGSCNATGTQATGCTDTSNNNYALVDVGANFADETQIIACSRCPNGLPAGSTITLTFAGAATDHLIEAFGCRETLTSDVLSNRIGFTSVTSLSTASGALSIAQEIVWAHIVFAGNPGAVSIAAPFRIADAVISNNIYAVSAYVRVTSNASVTAAWSWTTAQSGSAHVDSFKTVNFATTAAALAGSGVLACDTVQITQATNISGNGALVCDARPTRIWLGYIGGNGPQLNLTTLQNVFAGESIVLFGSTTAVGQQVTGATDSSGNNYTIIDAGPNATLETQLVACLVLTADLPAGSVISMAFASSGTDCLLEAYMVYGALVSDWGTSGNAGTGTATPSRITATFAQAEEIVFTHICWNGNPGTVGLGAPFHYATMGAALANPPAAGLANQSTDLYALTGYARIHATAPFSYTHTWPTSVGFREHGFSFGIARQPQIDNAALAGQGAITATPVEIASDFLAMSGQGAIALDAAHTVIDAAETLSGAGTLSADSFTFSGTVSASSPIGTGSLAATAFLYDIGIPQEAGVGTLTVGSTNKIIAAAALVAGAGAVIVAARHVIPSPTSAIAGHGVVQAIAALYAIDNSDLVGETTLFAFPGGLFGAAKANGAGTLIAAAVRWQADNGPEEFDGRGSLTIASANSPIAEAALVGSGSLSCRAVTIDSASASVVGGDGEISVAVLILRVAPSILTGAGAVAFGAYRAAFGSASLFDLSSLVCFPIQTAASSIVASGAGSVAASATIVAHSSEAISGAGSVTAQATHNPSASASLVGAGIASAAAKVSIGAASASLAGAGSVAASAAVIEMAMPQILGGGGAIITAGSIPVGGAANINGSGALQTSGFIALHDGALLMGEANLDPDVSIIGHLNDNNLVGAGAMFCDAFHPLTISADLGDPSFLEVDGGSVEHIVYPARIKVRTRKVRAKAA